MNLKDRLGRLLAEEVRGEVKEIKLLENCVEVSFNNKKIRLVKNKPELTQAFYLAFVSVSDDYKLEIKARYFGKKIDGYIFSNDQPVYHFKGDENECQVEPVKLTF